MEECLPRRRLEPNSPSACSEVLKVIRAFSDECGVQVAKENSILPDSAEKGQRVRSSPPAPGRVFAFQGEVRRRQEGSKCEFQLKRISRP